jgi:hypothetical protein
MIRPDHRLEPRWRLAIGESPLVTEADGLVQMLATRGHRLEKSRHLPRTTTVGVLMLRFLKCPGIADGGGGAHIVCSHPGKIVPTSNAVTGSFHFPYGQYSNTNPTLRALNNEA